MLFVKRIQVSVSLSQIHFLGVNNSSFVSCLYYCHSPLFVQQQPSFNNSKRFNCKQADSKNCLRIERLLTTSWSASSNTLLQEHRLFDYQCILIIMTCSFISSSILPLRITIKYHHQKFLITRITKTCHLDKRTQ